MSSPFATGPPAFIINEEEFPWVLLSCFGMFGKKCVTFIFRAFGAAVTGPLHQMNSVASKPAAEEFGAGADNVRLALCKH